MLRPGTDRSTRAAFAALTILVGWAAGTPLEAYAQATAVVASPVAGRVEVRSTPGGPFAAMTEATPLAPGSALRTGSDGFALLRYPDGTEAVVRPGSTVEIPDARGGLRVLLGKVLLRVRRLLTPGQERAYTSPTTVAAVRGTEFGLDVRADGSTRVYVFEGRVAVANVDLPESTVEVGAGYVTEVAPRRPPTPPRTFAPGEFDRGPSGEVERGEDRAVEAGQAPTVARYLAFQDHDLDAAANPAYLAAGPGTGVTGLALASGAKGGASVDVDGRQAFRTEEGVQRGLLQGMAWTELGPGLRVGAVLQGDVGEDRRTTVVRPPASTVYSVEEDASWWRVAEGRVLTSLSRGRTSLGIQFTRREAGLDAEGGAAGALTPTSRSDGSSVITSVGAGVRRQGRAVWGVTYRRAWIAGDSEGQSETLQTDGAVDAVEGVARRWDGAWGWGGWVRLERTRLDEVLRSTSGPDYTERLDVRTMRVGLGVGYRPSDGLLLSVDVAAGVADESATQTTPGGSVLEDERDLRLSGGVHTGVQVALSGPWHAEISVLHGLERIARDYSYPGASGRPDSARDVRASYATDGQAGLIYAAEHFTARYSLRTSGHGAPWHHTLLFAVSTW